MPQTTLISFYKYKGINNQWQAFRRMGNPPIATQEVEGLSFWKPLGIGAGNGFSIWPDFSMFALLAVFDSEKEALAYLQSGQTDDYELNALESTHILMHNIQAQGQWSLKEPFQKGTDLMPNRPLAVITRATIKAQRAHQFWWNVPSVSKSMNHHKELLFTKGIGEYPIFMQATFSIWASAQAMKDYAYHNPKHAEMIKKTRELNWYAEELFARFHLYDVMGTGQTATQLQNYIQKDIH